MSSVTLNPFQQAILHKVYEAFNKDYYALAFQFTEFNDLAEEHKLSHDKVRNYIQNLVDYGLLKWSAISMVTYTFNTIEVYENNFLTDEVFKNNEIRRVILTVLKEKYATNPTDFCYPIDFTGSTLLSTLPQNKLINNLWYIKEAYLADISFQSGGHFRAKINKYGLQLINSPPYLKKTFPISKNDYISLETVSEIIRRWTPHQKRKNEEGYKAELAEFLRNNGFSKTTEERGDTDVDILVNGILPIEIKKNPTKQELDRLAGQVMRMSKEFGQVLVVILDISRADIFEVFEGLFEGNNKVLIIKKS